MRPGILGDQAEATGLDLDQLGAALDRQLAHAVAEIMVAGGARHDVGRSREVEQADSSWRLPAGEPADVQDEIVDLHERSGSILGRAGGQSSPALPNEPATAGLRRA